MGNDSQKRQAGGRFEASTTHDDVMAVFEQVEGPVVTSSDVAEVCECSPKTARRKLDELASQGRIKGRETAGRTVWWRIDREEDGAATNRPASGRGKGVPSQTLLDALNGRTPIMLDPEGADPDELLESLTEGKTDDIIIEERDEEDNRDE